MKTKIPHSQDVTAAGDFEITENSKIFICYDRMEYLFSAITGEYQRYEKIDYDDFISQTNLIEVIT